MSNPRHNKPAGERERARRAVELRIAGHPYQAIAAELGYRDESGARKAVDRLLSRIAHEGVAELRAVEGRRLDELQRGVWAAAIAGDLEAIKTVLAIMTRRARLFGLDAPTPVAVGISAAEFAKKAAELLDVIGPGPLLELARTAPVDAEVIAEAGESEPDGWSNIGPDTPGYLTASPSSSPDETPGTVTGPAPQPIADAPPEREPQAEDELSNALDNCEDGEPEAVVPLPTGMRRIPAVQVLGGSRYDPLRGVRWW